MIRELLTRLTAAGANGVNLNVSLQGDRAIVIVQPKLNPMPYDSSPEGLKIHAAMQKPVVINAELDELDTELHVVVEGYLASFEGAMQANNVNEVIVEHTAATLTELTSKKAASASKKEAKQTAKASAPASQNEPEQETPATDAPTADTQTTEIQTDQPAQAAPSMADFEALFASSASTDATNTNQ